LSPNSVGDGLTPDHIPSFAAIVKNIEVSSGIKLTEEQKTSLRLNTNCLVYSTCTQQQESRNYGGRNNPTQIEQDSQDLRAAALRDIENIRGSLINQGYNAEDVDRSFQQLLDLNKKAGIHE
jgi:filamentous hemagglutinin